MILEILMGFCESIHTLLGFPAGGGTVSSAPTKFCNLQVPAGSEGLQLIAVVGPSHPSVSSEKADPPARGGLHGCCLSEGGLGLFTECLGSESCHGAPLEPEEVVAFGASTALDEAAEVDNGEERPWGCTRRKVKREFPPPLRWMAGGDGRRAAFLRAERSGGRLVLTKVHIDRPELFLTSREGGRLRLHLIEEEVEEAPARAEAEETTSSSSAVAEDEVEEAPSPTEADESPSSSSAVAENVDAGWEWSEEERRSGKRRWRCQDTLSSRREKVLWWSHRPRFVTTA